MGAFHRKAFLRADNVVLRSQADSRFRRHIDLSKAMLVTKVCIGTCCDRHDIPFLEEHTNVTVKVILNELH